MRQERNNYFLYYFLIICIILLHYLIALFYCIIVDFLRHLLMFCFMYVDNNLLVIHAKRKII